MLKKIHSTEKICQIFHMFNGFLIKKLIFCNFELKTLINSLIFGLKMIKFLKLTYLGCSLNY
jgi:hypothetical protein